MEHPGLRAAAPFAACTILGTGLAFLPQFGDRTGVALVALVANLMAGGLFAWILSGRRRTWRDPALVICLAVGLAALFDATGGTSSPLMPLVAVPVLWAGLFGARRDLLLVTLLTIALLVLPIVLVGGERYATSGLARAALWASISLLIGPAVQETVRNWRHERARHARLSRELADANARWRFVVDTIPQTALATLDDDLRIGLVAGSDVWSVGFGGSEGRLFGDYASPENTRTIRRLVDKAMGGELVGTSMISSHNGRELEILISRLVASDPDAEPPREVLLLARDVHQERRREREVVRERDRAERYFSESPHGIAVIGPDGVVRRANPALCQLTSTTQAELVGQPLEALVEKGTTVREHLERVFGTGQRAQVRLALRSAAGDPRPVAVSSSLMPGDAADVGLDGTVADDEDSVLMHVVDMSEQERYENRLTYLANHDPLTGLANRRRFEEELERHLDRCRRYGARGAVLMLDLDHFKEVNDTLGHPAGDELIVKLGTLLRRRLRSSDLVARLGGDEFAVLLPEVDRAGAEQTARGLVTAVREEVATMEGAAHRVTASMGVLMLAQSKLAVSEVMSTVDMLLYDAKEGGRDRFAGLDPATVAVPRTATRLHWAERIEQALARDEFELHLQPIMDLGTGSHAGAEALVRMRLDGQLVPPAKFLPVAERSNLITRLDRWVLRHSVALLEQLQLLEPAFQLEVNLSGRSVGDPAVEQELIAALARHTVDPRGLVLEITETAAVAHIEQARTFAERVTQLGCSFALDDFGAGFGSFYYLKHLLFDFVKIDGEFVATCDVNPRDRTILASIVSLAHGLGKRTIAEFVTSPQILQVVREEGVDFAQGFEIGRPVPAEQFLAELAGPPGPAGPAGPTGPAGPGDMVVAHG